MRLKNKTIWITGASSGVGEGLAHVLHREGANLILSARRALELERVRADCSSGPGTIDIVPFDLVDEHARAEAAAQVLAKHARLDMLINNAGISQRSLIRETGLDVDRQIMEVDFFAQVALTKLVLPRMLDQQDGHIVVTSSVAGKHGVPFRSAYCAAKHALHGYFETLRIELLDDNIRACMLVIAGVTSNVAEHALIADGSEFGHDDFNTGSGMTPDQCAEQALDAILANEYEPVISIAAAQQAMQIRATDPVEFTRRMQGMMKWMAK